MKKKEVVSIILPTFNEAENIIPLLEAIDQSVMFPHESIVVDDNSPDKTWDLVQKYLTKTKKEHIRVIRRTKNRGLTNSLQEGIDNARGSIIVWLDCDFSHPPEVIPQLIDVVQGGKDIAVASRFIAGGKQKPKSIEESGLAIFFSNILNNGLSKLFGIKFNDFTSGFVACRKEVFNYFRLKGDYGEYFIDFIVRSFRKGYKIQEIPYASASRRAGSSKTAPDIYTFFLHSKEYISTVFQLLILK